MIRPELIRQVAAKFQHVPQDIVKEILNATEEVVVENIQKGEDRIPLFSVMFISGKKQETRMRRNPHTGGTIEVPGYISPRARFTPKFKRQLRESGLEDN